MDVDVEANLCALVAGVSGLLDVTHVGVTGQTKHARLLVQLGVDALSVPAELTAQVCDNTRVDVAGAGAHNQAGKRGKAHGGLDGVAGVHRGDGCAVTQVADDLLQVVAAEQLSGLAGDELVAGAVEAILADLQLLGQLGVDGVGVRLCGQVGEERGVKDADMRHVGEQLSGGVDALDARRVVQRSQRRQILHGVHDFFVDENGGAELFAAVNGAVCHCHGCRQVWAVLVEQLENGGQRNLVVGQILVNMELAGLTTEHLVVYGAGGAGSDSLHQALGEHLLGLGVDHLVLDRAGAAVEYKNGLRHTTPFN